MAIYDPPDGTIDPRPRCTGNCCRGFSLEHPLAVVKREYEIAISSGKSELIPDVKTIFEMLIPLGEFRKQELFTCKHLGKNGDCGIYATRPQMCRDFPGPNPCPYRNCASHGPMPKWKQFWNWIRD